MTKYPIANRVLFKTIIKRNGNFSDKNYVIIWSFI